MPEELVQEDYEWIQVKAAADTGNGENSAHMSLPKSRSLAVLDIF